MRKIKAIVHRRATIAETHYLVVPTDNEDDVEGYVFDVMYSRVTTRPRRIEQVISRYDDAGRGRSPRSSGG